MCNKWKTHWGERHAWHYVEHEYSRLFLAVEFIFCSWSFYYATVKHKKTIIRKSKNAQWATGVRRQDLYLWLTAAKWQEVTGGKSCWSCCKLTRLQYSTKAQCRKWAHYCTSTPTASPSPPTTAPNSLPTTCAGLTGCPPPPTPSPPQHKPLYSCTSLPNRTLNTLCCFTLDCFNSMSEE